MSVELAGSPVARRDHRQYTSNCSQALSTAATMRNPRRIGSNQPARQACSVSTAHSRIRR